MSRQQTNAEIARQMRSQDATTAMLKRSLARHGIRSLKAPKARAAITRASTERQGEARAS